MKNKSFMKEGKIKKEVEIHKVKKIYIFEERNTR